MEIKGVGNGRSLTVVVLGGHDYSSKSCACMFTNYDGMFHMLQLKVIGIACFLLFFFSFAVYAMVKVTERENKKN